MSDQHLIPSTSEDEPPFKLGTRFTPKQRELILAALVVTWKDLPLAYPLEAQSYGKFCENLDKFSSIAKFERPPSIRYVRVIWQRFIDPNRLINEPGKGGPKKMDVDSNIKAHLAANPEDKTRAIASALGISQRTVIRRMKKN